MLEVIELKDLELEEAFAYRMVWSYPAATDKCDQFKLGGRMRGAF
jgi:hypothetical protein